MSGRRSRGTVAGVVFDPVRNEVFAAERASALRMDGAAPPRRCPDELSAAMLTGGIVCATEAEAKRAAKLDKRLFRRVGQRRALGSAALELAWTAGRRLDVCFHEQWIHPWDVNAGLFLCERTGRRGCEPWLSGDPGARGRQASKGPRRASGSAGRTRRGG